MSDRAPGDKKEKILGRRVDDRSRIGDFFGDPAAEVAGEARRTTLAAVRISKATCWVSDWSWLFHLTADSDPDIENSKTSNFLMNRFFETILGSSVI